MNILIVTHYFWPESFRVNDLAAGLVEKGHSITVMTNAPSYPEGRFYNGYGLLKKNSDYFKGVKVIRTPVIPRGCGSSLRMSLNYLSSAFFGSLVIPFLNKPKTDLIFVFQPSPVTTALPALFLKKLYKIPAILWAQDIWPETLSATGMVKSKFILKSVEKLTRFIYAGFDRILIQSRAFAGQLQTMGVSAGKIRYFPNCAEAFYKPMTIEPDAMERLSMPDGFRIMFAGNIGKAQDFPTILSAAEKLKMYTDIHWIILGDGSERSWVESRIRSRGLDRTVHLLGRYPVEAMPRFFAFSDVLLVTLKKEPVFELTIPSKVQSYLACAKPIVAALDGEGARVIENAGAGMACFAENPKALAETVLKFYNMSETDRKEMGNKGMKYFKKHFEREMLFDRLEGWMEELIVQPT